MNHRMKRLSRILYAEDNLNDIELTLSAFPDLFLLDIQRPEMDGIVPFKKIREFRKDLPHIAQTA
jgi:CheY-like chemotaxis protein